MGCCVSSDLNQELSLEEIEDYNKLNSEIKQILNNKNNIDIQNSDILLKLINRISIKIANCEEIIRKIKLKRFSSKFSGDTIKIVNGNINQLNKLSKYLNEQITENRRESLQTDNMLLKELGTKSVCTVNESHLKTTKSSTLNSFVYYKKCIKRIAKENTSQKDISVNNNI